VALNISRRCLSHHKCSCLHGYSFFCLFDVVLHINKYFPCCSSRLWPLFIIFHNESFRPPAQEMGRKMFLSSFRHDSRLVGRRRKCLTVMGSRFPGQVISLQTLLTPRRANFAPTSASFLCQSCFLSWKIEFLFLTIVGIDSEQSSVDPLFAKEDDGQK
jgi:hypothetical protein